MKSSQQLAEELANKCAVAIWGGEPSGHIAKETAIRDAKIIIYTIPLPELIEVARAAREYTFAISEEEQARTYNKIKDSLESLRATGKVEI